MKRPKPLVIVTLTLALLLTCRLTADYIFDDYSTPNKVWKFDSAEGSTSQGTVTSSTTLTISSNTMIDSGVYYVKHNTIWYPVGDIGYNDDGEPMPGDYSGQAILSVPNDINQSTQSGAYNQGISLYYDNTTDDLMWVTADASFYPNSELGGLENEGGTEHSFKQVVPSYTTTRFYSVDYYTLINYGQGTGGYNAKHYVAPNWASTATASYADQDIVWYAGGQEAFEVWWANGTMPWIRR